MATNTIVTVGGSGNLPQTNELPVDMSAKRLTAFPGLTPLTTILTKLSQGKAKNFQVELIESNEMPTTVVVATSESSAGTTVVFARYAETLVQDTILYNPRTHDYRSVDAQPTTQSTTVTISQCGTTSSAWLSGDEIEVLPPRLAENDALSTYRAASVQDSRVYNYQGIVKLQFSISRLLNALPTMFGGPGEKRKQLKTQKYHEFRIKGEKQKIFGGRSTTGTAPASKRSGGGLVHFLRSGTHYKDFEGVFTRSGFENWVGNYHDDNPDATNIAFCCAPNIIRQINGFAQDQVRISPNTMKFGLNLKQYQAGPLNVDLVPMPLLKSATTKGWGFLLDFSRIEQKDVDKPTYFPDCLNVGQSEVIYDTYREVTSMLVGNESRHGMCVGATLQ